MVVAYLRGLLKPSGNYGLRSTLAETAILEALSAQIATEGYTSQMAVDAAAIPALTEKGVRVTLKSLRSKLVRCSELRLYDVFRFQHKFSVETSAAANKNMPSLYQLYQLAEKSGIFEALREHDAETDTPQ